MRKGATKTQAGRRFVNRWTVAAVGTALTIGLWLLRDFRMSNASGAQRAVRLAGQSRHAFQARSTESSGRGKAGGSGMLSVERDEGPTKGSDSQHRENSAGGPDGGSAVVAREQHAGPYPATSQKVTDASAKLIGTWKLDDSIQRLLEMRADGTATMQVKLDYFSSLIYGQRMTLELSWDVCDGVLTHHLEKGTPSANVQRLIRDWGNERSYKVIRVSGDEMVLESMSDQDVHHWKRVEGQPSMGP